MVAVPDSAEYSVTIIPHDYVRFDDYLIYPIPRVVFEDTADCAYYKEVYNYDTSFYEKDTVYPNKIYEVNVDGHWRDQRVLELYLYPVQFNPKQRLMYFYHNMDLTIEYSGAVVENENGLGPFEEIGREVLLNYPGVDKEPESQVPPSVHFYTNLDTSNVADYIIVTHEDFSTNDSTLELIEQLAQWRVDHNRFDVGIVEIQDVYEQFPDSAPDSAAQLREFLTYAYDNWTASAMPDGHFGYCLLIGDWDCVPTYLEKYGSDPRFYDAFDGYFRDIDSPLLNGSDDIMVGRWPVKTASIDDLTAVCKKTINYEKNPSTNNWRRRGLLIAGPNAPGEGHLADALPYFTDISYDTLPVRWNDFDLSAPHPESLFMDSIHTLLNYGEILAGWYGHGWFNYWTAMPWTSGYSTTYAETLQNDSLLPVVLSNACVTASFQWDHPYYDEYSSIPDSLRICLGECFLFNPDGGAVAFYGAASPVHMGSYSTIPIRRILRYQHWILANALINVRHSYPYCLLGDPALDIGDYTAFPSLPDLVIRPHGIDITLSSPYPYPESGDTIPIRVKVFNIGAKKANDVDVRFEIYCDEVRFYDDTITINKIQPRDSAVVISYWQTSTTHPDFYGEIGDCEFRITVDPFSEIDESWEANNQTDTIRKVALYPHQPGWPKKIFGHAEPAIANLDGQGTIEIVFASTDSVYVFSHDGTIFRGWPQPFGAVGALVLGDLDTNGTVEIAAVRPDSITVFDYQGNTMSGWPTPVPVSEYTFQGFPALGHIVSSTLPEIVVTAMNTEEMQKIKVFVFNNAGGLQDSFSTHHKSRDQIVGVAVEEIFGGDNDEIILSYFQAAEQTYHTDIFNASGLDTTLDYGNNLVIPALVDINDDQFADIIIGDQDGKIRVFDAENDTVLWEQETDGPINSSPAVGNIHPVAGGVEVTFGNDTSQVHLRSASDGITITPWHYTISPSTKVSISPAVADITGDDNPDIIIGALDEYVYAFEHTEDSIPPFPLPVVGKMSSPIIGDIDGDGRSEIILSSLDGYLHVWEIHDSEVTLYSLEWPQFHHNYKRTGLYGWQ